MFEKLNIAPNGWALHRVALSSPRTLHAVNVDVFAFTQGATNSINGDGVGISYNKASGCLRIVVTDGVTGNKANVPEGVPDPAQYASQSALDQLLPADNIERAALELNGYLHRHRQEKGNPAVVFASADVYVPFTGFRLESLVRRNGDCEIYSHQELDGWTRVLESDMLTPQAREDFEKLAAHYIPCLDTIRKDLGRDSQEFRKIYNEFYELEQELLGDSTKWDSAALGRFPTSESTQSAVKSDLVKTIDAVLVATDGAHISADELNSLGSPSELSPDFFKARQEGWNDMAIGAAVLSR